MPFAVALLVSEAQRGVFDEVFLKADTNQRALGLPPHMSFAVFDEVDADEAVRAIRHYTQSTAPLQIYMSSIGMFPTEHPVVYALPTINSTLLDAQRKFHNELGDLSDKCWDYYKPNIWSPHLTLGSVASLDSALRIISVAYNAKLRGNYIMDRMALIEFSPTKIISIHSFQDNDHA